MAARVRGARALSFLSLLLVACSGAANQDLFEDAPGQNDQNDTSASATQPAPSSTKPGSTNDPAPTPVPTAKDGGTDAPPPPEPAKCTPEAESNDSIAKANTFTTSFCGKIDSLNDVDFARFVVPAGANNLEIKHDEKGGKVAYRYYVNGVALPVGLEIVQPIAGATYSVQIKLAPGSNGGDRPTYQLDLSFSK